MTLTPREAAFVANSDVQLVQRAVDGGVVQKRTRTVQGRKTRVLGRSELRFFGALRGHEDTLTPAGRQKLYKAVQHPRGGKAVLGVFVVDVEDVDRQIERRRVGGDLTHQGRVTREGGEPGARQRSRCAVAPSRPAARGGGCRQAARRLPLLLQRRRWRPP